METFELALFLSGDAPAVTLVRARSPGSLEPAPLGQRVRKRVGPSPIGKSSSGSRASRTLLRYSGKKLRKRVIA